MDDFPGLLARDFGFKPQGKSAPMAPSRSNNLSANYSSSNIGLGSNASEFTKSSYFKSTAVFDDHDRDGLLFNDVFGGPPKYSSTSEVDSRSGGGGTSSFDYDLIFKDQNAKSQNSKLNSMPVFDKPVYDDDIFEGLPGLKSSSATASSAAAAASPSAKFDAIFSSISGSPPKPRSARDTSPFDDLLGNLGKKETESRVKREKDASAFDDLLPGFGRSSSPTSNRSTSESSRSQKPPSNSTKTASSVMEDPFVVLESTSTPVGSSSEVFTDPPEEISKFGSTGSAKVNGSFVSGGVFDDLDPLTSFGKFVPPVSPEVNKRGKDRSPLRSKSMSGTQTHPRKESVDRYVENSEGYAQSRTPVGGFQGSNETFFDMRSVSTDSQRSAGRATSPPSYMSASHSETNSQIDTTPKSEEIFESVDDVWLTVSEIPLFTQPTSAPPPSRPPPPRLTRVSKSDTGSANARKKANEYSSSFSNSSQYAYSPKSARASARSPVASQIDELEDFPMGGSWNNVNEYGEVPTGEDVESSVAAASAAAMKEAMDRAEAKFRHAKEMRERESLKAARSRESVQLDRDERSTQDAPERDLRERQERLDRERQHREKEEEEQRRLEREREEKEREQRRLEKESERAREIEKEREKARQAVERATREARERAAAEARLKAERAAVDKANAAARERAERAAVQRAQAEARERAAAEARDRAERAAAEARERANAEAREKEVQERASAARAEAESRHRAERAAVERAAAEARERAAAEARERAAAAAAAAVRTNQNQQKNDNDLESFFSMSSRPSSAPRPRANTSDPLFDAQSNGPEPARKTSVGISSQMKKASSTTNIVDDLSSIFGAAGSSAGEFQEVEGETEERRRARLERHQRTQERAAKALAEKNQRDLQVQRDQAERHRIAETLDVEIKRWAAGKEGNIRSLLATLQYVLWPECGWQPVSLTDLITGAAVKKVYRKATLCIHPDKVQQKGANLQQKYIAEKVFDLLKEAWNKFNSEELF